MVQSYSYICWDSAVESDADMVIDVWWLDIVDDGWFAYAACEFGVRILCESAGVYGCVCVCV